MKPYLILASLLASITTYSASVIPTPVGRPAGALGPGVIIARSYPGLLPINRTLIMGRDQFGFNDSYIIHNRDVSWSWNRSASRLDVRWAGGSASFNVAPPYPGWKFAITISGGGPEPIYTSHSVMGYGYYLTTPCTLVIPEALSTGSVILPNTSSRHVVFRYEVGL
jgi:hypothetical protein